jgi:hypothetical protein
VRGDQLPPGLIAAASRRLSPMTANFSESFSVGSVISGSTSSWQ